MKSPSQNSIVVAGRVDERQSQWRRTDRANLEKKGVKVNSKRPGGRASSQVVVSLDMCAEDYR
ncbi:MAG: hypothetical protein WBL91_11810, partial [Pseudolabrys sp.]